MNNCIKNAIIKSYILVLLISFSGCKKFLEVSPTDQVTSALLFSNTNNADLF